MLIRETPALCRRWWMYRRSIRSSLRSSGYSLSGKPIGAPSLDDTQPESVWMCFLTQLILPLFFFVDMTAHGTNPVGYNDGNMAVALADPMSRTARARSDTLQISSFVGEDRSDEQIVGIDRVLFVLIDGIGKLPSVGSFRRFLPPLCS